jgi:hypothetical protein
MIECSYRNKSVSKFTFFKESFELNIVNKLTVKSCIVQP